MNKRVKFLGLDVLYSVILVIVATLCSLIQIIGVKVIVPGGFYDGPPTMEYNLFFYIVGFLVFVGFLFLSFKRFLKTRYQDYPVRRAGVVIIHFMISFVFCFAMFLALIFAALLFVGFETNLLPELLVFITVFIWPIISFVLMNAALIVFLVKTRNEKEESVEEVPHKENKNMKKNKKN